VDEQCSGCLSCRAVSLTDHANRKREKRFAGRKHRRKQKPGRGKPWGRIHSDEKRIEAGRARARERGAEPEAMPLRAAPWTRWDIWNWT